ncbi:uncharacterized protein LOC134833353 [Culicoides brevitarsis]|uniref:uncharacterized protein LOC134833353 n=1 Tax=Culicoides brevitarsis TaxID=469753 RepID=UPI00307B5688
MEVDEIRDMQERKLKRILDLLSTSKTNVQNDCYLEKLLQKIIESGNANTYKISFEWFLNLINLCEAHESPHNTVVSFGMKLATNCVKFDDSRVEQLLDVMTRFLRVINTQEKLRTPSVLFSYIVLLKQVAKTECGLRYLKETGLWQQLIDYKSPNYTIYINRELASFFYEIMKAFDKADEEVVVKNILEALLSPLLNVIWMDENHHVFLDNPETKEIVLKMMDVLEQIYLKAIEDPELSHIPYYLFIEMRIENKTWKLRDISLLDDFSIRLGHIAAIANFCRYTCMKIPARDTTTKPLTLEKFCINFYNFINYACDRQSAETMVNVTDVTTRLWYKAGPRRPTHEIISTHKLKFGDQLLVVQLMPMLYLIRTEAPEFDPDYIDEFCNEFFFMCCEQTVRHLYAMKEILHLNRKNTTDLACRSISRITSSGVVIDKPRALLALRYFLKSLIEFLPKDFDIVQNSTAYLSFDSPTFLLAILTGVNSLIKTYDITCTDLPSTNLHKIGLYLLCVCGLNTQHKIQVIKMLENAIVRFSSNQVPLMIGDLSGSGYEHLGYVIYKYIHSNDWDVRDSILELITTIIDISCTKFAILQSLFVKQDFCGAILTMSKSDAEPYVRASALKCLKTMSRVNKFGTILQEMDLIQHLCELVRTEDEAIVRRDAIDVLRDIYLHQRSPKNLLATILPTMIYCGAVDLHWEVRINALRFWDHLLDQCFTAEGYSDYGFPPQCFSTKLKKIVTLNENSIKAKLTTILQEFQQHGGFGVLLANLEETTDTEVMKVAVQIINKLKKRLEKYDFTGSAGMEIETNNETLPNAEIFQVEAGPAVSETILDSVVDSDDINLLVNAHQNALNNDREGHRFDKTDFEAVMKVTADAFLNAIKDKDFESIIESRVRETYHIMNFSQSSANF